MSHDSSVRVRFAPSPTGHLHIGSFRTALFNWLYARHNNGTFLVRIEDTDTERSKKEYTAGIIQALHWVDLTADETIIVQSERLERHQAVLKKLLADGHAYKCFCTPEEIKARAGDTAFIKYDGTCRNRSDEPNAPFVIRFKIPDEITEVSFDDLIRGRVTVARDQLDDFIIARSDGRPMYNFVVVVDDADMKITQVIRGEDHISNTPKQILLYRACGFTVPQFAHIPLILGPSGDRLSKRDGATSALEYKRMGYLPDALVNYLVRLGWAHGDQEIFSREELVKFFTLKAVGKKGSIFDIEKLNWLNGVYLREMSTQEILQYVTTELDVDIKKRLTGWDEKTILRAIDLYKERAVTLRELIDELCLIHDGPAIYTDSDIEKWTEGDTKSILKQLSEALHAQELFTVDACKATVKALAKQLDIKMVNIAQPIRIALIGKSSGPGVFDMLALLGKQESVERIARLRDTIQ